jgi:AraC family carnitine catabolism transcriptional activator
MSISTERLPDQAGRYSTIFVVASFEAKDHAKNLKLKMWLQRERTFGAQIGGIETGTEILAAASLLDGRPAAVHWDNLEGFQETYPKVKASTQLFTLDAKVITCAGAIAISDMMLAWIAAIHGPNLATEIVEHLLHPRMRDSVEGQLAAVDEVSEPVSAQVASAIRLMQQSLTTPLSCEEIAAAVGLSKRQLERHFKQYTASAPLQYYVSLRVATAHKLLQQTDLSVSQVAAASGFESPEHFSRVYKTRFGIPPSLDRRQALTAPVMRRAARPPIWRGTNAQPHG